VAFRRTLCSFRVDLQDDFCLKRLSSVPDAYIRTVAVPVEIHVAISEVVIIHEVAATIVIIKMEVIGIPVQIDVRQMRMWEQVQRG
jgi:hypothetical protein